MEKTVFKQKYFASHNGEILGESRTDTPSLVDVKGYISRKKQILTLEAAGVRLEKFRRGELYEGDEPDVDGPVSPIADPDFMPSVDMPNVTEQAYADFLKRQQAASSVEEKAAVVASENSVNKPETDTEDKQ